MKNLNLHANISDILHHTVEHTVQRNGNGDKSATSNINKESYYSNIGENFYLGAPSLAEERGICTALGPEPTQKVQPILKPAALTSQAVCLYDTSDYNTWHAAVKHISPSASPIYTRGHLPDGSSPKLLRRPLRTLYNKENPQQCRRSPLRLSNHRIYSNISPTWSNNKGFYKNNWTDEHTFEAVEKIKPYTWNRDKFNKLPKNGFAMEAPQLGSSDFLNKYTQSRRRSSSIKSESLQKYKIQERMRVLEDMYVDKPNTTICEYCERVGLRKRVAAYCHHCRKRMCKMCCEDHENDALTTSHAVVDLQSLSQDAVI